MASVINTIVSEANDMINTDSRANSSESASLSLRNPLSDNN